MGAYYIVNTLLAPDNMSKIPFYVVHMLVSSNKEGDGT